LRLVTTRIDTQVTPYRTVQPLRVHTHLLTAPIGGNGQRLAPGVVPVRPIARLLLATTSSASSRPRDAGYPLNS